MIDNVKSGATTETDPYSYALTEDINIMDQENAAIINLFLSYNENSFASFLKLNLLNKKIYIEGINTVIIV